MRSDDATVRRTTGDTDQEQEQGSPLLPTNWTLPYERYNQHHDYGTGQCHIKNIPFKGTSAVLVPFIGLTFSKFYKGFPGKTIGHPLVLGLSTNRLVKPYCRFIPVKHTPLEAATIFGNCQLRQMF